MTDTSHALELKQIRKAFGAVQVIHGVDLQIEEGEFVTLLENPAKYEQALKRAEVRFRGALDWLRLPMPAGRTIPLLPADPDLSELADVQGGIVRAYPKVSEGCLVLVAAQSAATLDELGSYLVVLEGDASRGESASLQLSTLRGALRLTGSGEWSAARLRFSGQASAAAGSEDVLNNLLNIIGRRQGAVSVISIG